MNEKILVYMINNNISKKKNYIYWKISLLSLWIIRKLWSIWWNYGSIITITSKMSTTVTRKQSSVLSTTIVYAIMTKPKSVKSVQSFTMKNKISFLKISLRSCRWIGRMDSLFRIRFCHIYDTYRMFKYFELFNYKCF